MRVNNDREELKCRGVTKQSWRQNGCWVRDKNKSSQNWQLFSYLQGCWRNGHQSHVFELRRSGHQSQADTFKSLSILENTGRAGTGLWRWKDLSRLGYCQSNCVNCWHCKCTIMCLFQDVEVQSKVRTNTVHHIWNINHCTVKISRSK